MRGLMQNRELLIPSILTHAARDDGAGEIVARRDNGRIDRTTYAALERRARRLAGALIGLGVQPGNRVGTLAMNSDRHGELHYGISGIGAICNTINPRLSHDPSLVTLLNGERATWSAAVPTVWPYPPERRTACDAETRALGRRGVPARAHGRVRRDRHPRLSRLGNDREQPARHLEHAEAGDARNGSRNAARSASDAGAHGVRHRCACRERCGGGSSLGRQDTGLAQVPRSLGASGSYRQPESDVGRDGWFPTGDVGVINPKGFVLLTDRMKDLIKSGGEWISSIALENIAVGHPAVAEAAAIAVPDDRWGERPLLIVVPREGCAPEPDELRAFFAGKVPSWSVPDRVLVVESIPPDATGKLLKTELRRLYAAAPASVMAAG